MPCYDGSDERLWAMVDRMKIAQRIACPELGYSTNEARYVDVHEWEMATKQSWNNFINNPVNQKLYFK